MLQKNESLLKYIMEKYLGKVERTLKKRDLNQLKRKLTIPKEKSIDFTSNDYIGFSRDTILHENIRKATLLLSSTNKIGSTGSRLLSGNNSFYEGIEKSLRVFHDGESALLFNSGYDLNLGLIGCIAQKKDCFVFDSLCHNSIREGLKLSRATQKVIFSHNNIVNLEEKVKNLRKQSKVENIFVVVESVYSMDGDCAPIRDILEICRQHGALLIVDEAHGLGVFGDSGCGLVQSLSLHKHPNLLCRIYTFGKALGAHGAVVIGPLLLKEYLLNYCRPLIYSTALSFHALTSILEGYKHLVKVAKERQIILSKLTDTFQNSLRNTSIQVLESKSPIQGVVIPGNENVVRITNGLQEVGFDARPIRSPTVPKGSERIRIVLHSHNSIEDVKKLTFALIRLVNKPSIVKNMSSL